MKKVFLIVLVIPLLLTAQSKPTSADSLYSDQFKNKTITYPDTAANKLQQKKSELSDYYYKAVIAIFILLAMLIAGIFIYKKYFYNGNPIFNARIRVIAKQAIAPKQSIVIVNIEGKRFALAATEHNINTICELAGVEDEIPDNMNVQNPFGKILNRITNKE